MYLSVFSPNAGKCGPEKTPYLESFHAVSACNMKLTFAQILDCRGEIMLSSKSDAYNYFSELFRFVVEEASQIQSGKKFIRDINQ